MIHNYAVENGMAFEIEVTDIDALKAELNGSTSFSIVHVDPESEAKGGIYATEEFNGYKVRSLYIDNIANTVTVTMEKPIIIIKGIDADRVFGILEKTGYEIEK